MVRIFIITFLSFINLFAQRSSATKADSFIGVDIYENKYLIKYNKIIKHTKSSWLTYLNPAYGTPSSVDVSNPLQILILYKDINKVVVLDNQLVEIDNFKVPNGSQLISNAGKNKVWIYNDISNTLNLFNFSTNKTEVSSLPLKHPLKRIKGNLNGCRAINTNNDWITFNNLGRESEKINIKNALASNSLLTYHKVINNELYFKDHKILSFPNNVKCFDIIYDRVYYFDGENIYNLSIK